MHSVEVVEDRMVIDRHVLMALVEIDHHQNIKNLQFTNVLMIY